MAKINLRRRSIPSVGSMRDSVIICTWTERPDEDVSTIVARPGVFRAHARVRTLQPDQILDFMAVFGSQDRPAVEIAIRVPPDVKIDLNHWVYRETGPAKIWYKVRSVQDFGDVGRFLLLRCSIDTVNDPRTDPATQQPPPAWEVPMNDDYPV